jgi:dTDP-4-amino-4,6-dideoxygalactose transaminase
MCLRFTSLADHPNVPVADPRAGYLAHKREIDEAVQMVLSSSHYILGPEVEAFETEFANYIDAPAAVGLANGTDGIAIALRSLGVEPGDEVITVSHTAVATVAGIEQAGAIPVLVDVEPGFLTLDPQRLAEALTSRTRAVVPVHLYGQAADLAPISSFCREHGLALIEDASQAHGAMYKGRKVGSIGDAGVFSCYPTKNLGALGDGGIVTFADPQVAARARRLRQYGWAQRNSSLEPGVNSRLDEVQAAVLRVKLRYLNQANAARREHARTYLNGLSDSGVGLPRERADALHVFHLFVIEVHDRAGLIESLGARGVGTAVHFPTPVHRQPAYQERIRYPAPLTVTDSAAQTVLSLPLYPELATQAIGHVIEVANQYLRRSQQFGGDQSSDS